MRFGVVIGCLVVLGCTDNTASLGVDLRTDFTPVVEFSDVRVTLSSSGSGDLTQGLQAVPNSFDVAQRVATFDDLPFGDYRVRVELLASDGRRIGQREQVGTLNGMTFATLVISSLCEGVSCPADDPAATECSGGRCVEPSCSPENPSACPSGCRDDSDCVSDVTCATGVCTPDGACLLVSIAGGCSAEEYCNTRGGCTLRPSPMDAGPMDAGPMDAGPGLDASTFDALMQDAYFDTPIAPDVELDAEPDASAPCMCVLPSDVCGTYGCTRSGVECNAITRCPDDYTCTSGDCVCDDILLCGRVCTSDEQCDDSDQQCDVSTNRCRARLPCVSTASCGAGESCVDRGCGGCPDQCIPNGPAPVGAPCDIFDNDCASGRCVGGPTGVCAEACLTNLDCGPDLLCRENERFGGPEGAACVLPTTRCTEGQCADDEACTEFGTCERLCNLSADCPSGEACQRANGTGPGTCRPGPECMPNELIEAGTRCALPQACWLASPNCPVGYECTGGSTIGRCSRAL